MTCLGEVSLRLPPVCVSRGKQILVARQQKDYQLNIILE